MKKLIAALLSAVCIFSLFACAKTDNGSYWTITKKVSSDGQALEYYAVLYLSSVSSSKKIDEVWVNVGETTDEQVVFDMAFGSSSSSLTYKKQTGLAVDKKVAEKTGGWVRICDGLNVTYNYAEISTSDAMNFYGIVFLTEDHEVIKAAFSSAGERKADNHNIRKKYDAESEDGENAFTPDKIADDDPAFDYSSVIEKFEQATASEEAEEDSIQS